MKKRKIIYIFAGLLFINLILGLVLFVEFDKAKYYEINKTVVEFDKFQTMMCEGKTKEDNSFANQSMSFINFDLNKHKDLEFVHWEYLDGDKWTLKTLVELAEDFESKNPGYRILAGINGDFFSMSNPHEPINNHVTNYNSTRNQENSYDVLAVDTNGKIQMNADLGDYTECYYLRIYDESGYPIKEVEIDSFNEKVTSGTSIFLPNNICDTQSSYYIVKNANIRSQEDSNDNYYYLNGQISSVNYSTLFLRNNEFAIETSDENLKQFFKIGTTVSIQKGTTSDFSFKSVGGYAGNILKNRKIVDYESMNGPEHKSERHPRSVIAQKKDGSFMIGCIDGRNPELNRDGVTLIEAAKVLKKYGCVNAVALDGGGSSTLLVKENNEFRIINTVSNKNQELRRISDGWFLIEKTADVKLTNTLQTKENSLNYSIEFINKEKISKVYAVHNGDKTEISLNSKEYTLNCKGSENEKNFLYFILECKNGNVIYSNLYTNKS